MAFDTKKLKPPPGHPRFRIKENGEISFQVAPVSYGWRFVRELDGYERECVCCVAYRHWRLIRDENPESWDNIKQEKMASDQMRYWDDFRESK